MAVKRVLLIGAGKDGTACLCWLKKYNKWETAAVIDKNFDAPGIELAKSFHIPVDNHWQQWIGREIDIIIDATRDVQERAVLNRNKNNSTIIIPAELISNMTGFLNEQNHELKEVQKLAYNQRLIFEHMQEGVIVIDNNEMITYINRRGEEILGTNQQVALGVPLRQVVSQLKLPQVLRSRKKEINQKLTLESGRQYISDLVPIMDDKNHLKGAFAILRDLTEVIHLAEEVTSLKEAEKVLESILHFSNEAISVVNEQGIKMMVNSAYTRLTGLSESEIIGNPTPADIADEKSVYMKVLQTRKPIRGARMRVGRFNKEVLVNVAPLIVSGKLKGSVGVLHDTTALTALSTELNRTKQIVRSLETNYTFQDIIGSSNEMKLAVEQAKVSARTASIVLLRGEYGTGKEIFAKAVHNESDRRNHKFIRVNCAVVEKSKLELDLFGGSGEDEKVSLFEQANNGTVFLEEIGELSLFMQKKLFAVIQNQEISRIGSSKKIPINVRVITSTNVNLEKAIVTGNFQEDLYYFLNRFTVYIPALRERKKDIKELTERILNKISQEYGKTVKSLHETALEYLLKYDWPGNLRELENVLRQAVISMENREEIIMLKHLPSLQLSATPSKPNSIRSDNEFDKLSLQAAVEQMEKHMILNVLENTNWNKVQTAEKLDISIRNLYYKMKKYNLMKA